MCSLNTTKLSSVYVIVFLLAIFSISLLGCMHNKNSSSSKNINEVTENGIEIINNDKNTASTIDVIDVPDNVSMTAKMIVTKTFNEDKLQYSEYEYVDWRISNLIHSHTYEDIKGMRVVVYQMNYEFLSNSPQKIQLVGGMRITDDNWVTPIYRDATYLVFFLQDGKLNFKNVLIQNDCKPGDPLFTEDILKMFE
jgi:hypothetical protein